MRHKPNRPLGRIRRGGQLPHGIQQLAQLQPGIAAEGIVGQLQGFGLHLQLSQPLGHIGIRGQCLAQMRKCTKARTT